jgi:hypothetical protein
MTVEERAREVIDKLFSIPGAGMKHYNRGSFHRVLGPLIAHAITAAIEDRDRDWSHALKEAVEAQFPEWGDFHEWPATPDVGAVCDWLGRLIKAVKER